MAGVEFLDMWASDDGQQFSTAGTYNAWLMAHALMHKDHHAEGTAKVYCIAQEMRMNLVSGYLCTIAERPGSWRCFQGDADYISSMVNDPQYAGLIEKALRLLR